MTGACLRMAARSALNRMLSATMARLLGLADDVRPLRRSAVRRMPGQCER